MPRKFLVSIVLSLGLPFHSAWGQCTSQGAATSYQVPSATCYRITGANGVCRDVDNQSATGLAIFVPNNTGSEWSSFYGSPPAGVTVGSCCSLTSIQMFGTAGAQTPITIPTGCSQVTVYTWGAGGGGGGTSPNASAADGAAGGYANQTITLYAGATLTVTVGGGGTGGREAVGTFGTGGASGSTGNAGGNGGTSAATPTVGLVGGGTATGGTFGTGTDIGSRGGGGKYGGGGGGAGTTSSGGGGGGATVVALTGTGATVTVIAGGGGGGGAREESGGTSVGPGGPGCAQAGTSSAATPAKILGGGGGGGACSGTVTGNGTGMTPFSVSISGTNYPSGFSAGTNAQGGPGGVNNASPHGTNGYPGFVYLLFQ